MIFAGIGYFSYIRFIKPTLNVKHALNKEFINRDKESDDVLILLFKTAWCPYCKRAIPEWKKFEDYARNVNNTNDYKLTLRTVDCDDEPDLAEKFKVEGYPTIKLIYKGKTYDYDAKPDFNNLVEFLETSIA